MSQEYPKIIFEDVIVDTINMKLVQNPQDYKMLVMPNLYGDMLSYLAVGSVGGLGGSREPT